MTMKALKYTGLVLFFGGFLLFLATLGMGDYRLSDQILKEKLKEKHYQALRPRFEEMVGKTYPTAIPFVREVQKPIEEFNKEARSQQKWDQVIYTDYTFSLTKASTVGWITDHKLLWLLLTIGLMSVGGLVYILPAFSQGTAGIKNDHIYHRSGTNRGWLGILIGTFLILFYVMLYWHAEYITNWVLITDPLSQWLSGGAASQWFMYGLLYTLAILVMGVRFMLKYRHNKYQLLRTASVMFFQLAFAFTLPQILASLNLPSMDLKNIWPLNYDFFFDYKLNAKIEAGTIGIFMLGWGIALFAIGVPVITYFYGKRWYCSWVCGCGGLAETAGDPYRQLSDKSLTSWQIERWLVHSVLVFAVVMTIAVLYTYFTGSNQFLGINTYDLRQAYGFAIGAAFAGVIGVGFYPLMGNRVWCRFGCPLAAYLGIVQRFKSRFRITTNGGQCISCGNCSTYCEMGIDVRWYAQRGQNIVRASCVGCGICSAVCPRGVLKLENKQEEGRFGKPILIGNESISLDQKEQ